MKKNILLTFFFLFKTSCCCSDYDVHIFNDLVNNVEESINSFSQFQEKYKSIREFESEFQKFYQYEISHIFENQHAENSISKLKESLVDIVHPFDKYLDNALTGSADAVYRQAYIQKILLSKICNGLTYVLSKFSTSNVCESDFDYFTYIMSVCDVYLKLFKKEN